MKPIILSLGGSIIIPDDVDVPFLNGFSRMIHEQVAKGRSFVIVCGGGGTARVYQNAAKGVVDVPNEDLDWLGIHATRLNAHLMRTIFRDIAAPAVVKDPTTVPETMEHSVVIAAGWKPGASTDNVAVRIADALGAEMVINMSNIAYVYDKDPAKHEDAKPLESITWEDFRKLVGDEWDPGLHAPFDPIASQYAESKGMRVVIVKGTEIETVKTWIEGNKAEGTLITPA